MNSIDELRKKINEQYKDLDLSSEDENTKAKTDLLNNLQDMLDNFLRQNKVSKA